MNEAKPRATLGGLLGWVAGLAIVLAVGRVSPGLAFTGGIGLSLAAVLRYVPARRLGQGGVRLDEAVALLVLLIGLTALSAPAMNRSFCVAYGPGELARQFRDPPDRTGTAGVE